MYYPLHTNRNRKGIIMKFNYETLLLAQLFFLAYKEKVVDIEWVKEHLTLQMGKENFEKNLENIKKTLDK